MSPPQAPSFAAALLPTASTADLDRLAIPQGWGQGRATFGGLVLAAALAAARRRLPAPRPCRALAATFPGPVAPGTVELAVRPLRHGRAASYLQIELRQGPEVGCVALATFGGPRPTTVAVPSLSAPPAAAPEGLPLLVTRGGQAPEFTHHFDYRLAFGDRPYSRAQGREIGGWCRFRDEPGPLGEDHVVALLDAWPSPAVARLASPAPAASMTWSLELLPIEPAPDPGGWWLYHAALDASVDGYAHGEARLWSPAGRLAALSRQAVAVFG